MLLQQQHRGRARSAECLSQRGLEDISYEGDGYRYHLPIKISTFELSD